MPRLVLREVSSLQAAACFVRRRFSAELGLGFVWLRRDGGGDGGSEQSGDYGAAQEEQDPGLKHQEAAVFLRQPRQGEVFPPFSRFFFFSSIRLFGDYC